MNAIVTRDLGKRFGSFPALTGLNISVPLGSVFGFLGPNGAGKTSVMRILTGLARPTSGEAEVLGYKVGLDTLEISRKIGYLPENPAFYGWMNAPEYLAFCADLFGLFGADRRSRLDYLLDFSGLAGNLRPTAHYSRGMRQRLGIAQALINDPELLLLDEPTSALDPLGRKEVLDMIANLSEEKTVFLSTHILEDVERVCDRVAMLNKGRGILEADLASLKADHIEPVFLIDIDGPIDGLISRLSSTEWVHEVTASERTVRVKVSDFDQAQIALPKIISELSLPLRQFKVGTPTLEEIFLRIMA